MAVPFEKKKDFSNRLKGKDIKPLEPVEILNEGEWQEDVFKDGSISKGYWVKVKYKGQEKELKVTRASFDNLSPEWGNDTKGWVGKTAIMTIHPYEKGKGILLSPKPEDKTGNDKIAWDE